MAASDRPGQAAAAIEALGESPSPSDARRELAEFDAKDLAAALVSRGGGGGGFAPVACLLACDADFDIHLVGDYDTEWDALYDNFWDLNPLAEIPAGLGLDFDFDGTAGLIVPTEAGVWSLSYFGDRQPDADLRCSLRLGLGVNIPWARQGTSGSPNIYLAGGFTGPLPAGTQLSHRVAVTGAGASNPSNVTQMYLSIVRLA